MTSVQEGNNITLLCNVSGKPAPVMAWTKAGSSQVLSHTSLLSVVNVSRPGTADNTIQYQCKASNGVKTPATATVNVTVHQARGMEARYTVLIHPQNQLLKFLFKESHLVECSLLSMK